MSTHTRIGMFRTVCAALYVFRTRVTQPRLLVLYSARSGYVRINNIPPNGLESVNPVAFPPKTNQVSSLSVSIRSHNTCPGSRCCVVVEEGGRCLEAVADSSSVMTVHDPDSESLINRVPLLRPNSEFLTTWFWQPQMAEKSCGCSFEGGEEVLATLSPPQRTNGSPSTWGALRVSLVGCCTICFPSSNLNWNRDSRCRRAGGDEAFPIRDPGADLKSFFHAHQCSLTERRTAGERNKAKRGTVLSVKQTTRVHK